MIPIATLLMILLTGQPPAEASPRLEGTRLLVADGIRYFPHESVLRPEQRRMLKQAIQYLKERPQLSATFRVGANEFRDVEKNRKFAAQRAHGIRVLIAEAGLDPSQYDVKSDFLSDPLLLEIEVRSH